MDNPFFKQLESQPYGSQAKLAEVLPQLRFDDQGLIPVIAQQHDSLEVLMVAWMNRDAIDVTLNSGRVCYWSRSRQQLWRKGESSGHTQHLIEMRMDCDGDALLCLVDQKGPACHTNRNNCFYLGIDGDKVVTLNDPVAD